MSEHTPAPDPDRLRASDADRERVAQALHHALAEGRLDVHEVDERLAQVYASKTIGELRPITRDLPGAGELVTPPVAPATPATAAAAAVPESGSARVVAGGQRSGKGIAVMSGTVRRGRWTVPETFYITAVMGGAELDLTEARLAGSVVTIQVFALMGGIELTVPDDIIVEDHVFAFMGGVDNKVQNHTPTGFPVVRVTGFVMMGGVDIKPARGRRIGRGTT